MHVLQEGCVLLAHVDPLRDQLVQHFCLLAGLMAYAHGIVHRDDRDHTGHCKNGRVDPLAACCGNHHGAYSRAVGAGHTAIAPHTLQLELAQQDEIDDGL